MGKGGVDRVGEQVDAARDEVRERGGAALVGHVRRIGPQRIQDHVHRQMREIPIARRSVGDLVVVLAKVLAQGRCIDDAGLQAGHDQQRLVDCQRHGLEILGRCSGPSA